MNRRWPDFPASVNYLAERNPRDLVEQILRAYLDLARPKIGRDGRVVASPEPADLLADRDLYLTFLQEQFPAPHIDPDLEAEAHGLLNDPPAMQNLMVSHLRDMWEMVLAPEWTRVRPLLQASVDAFRQADMGRMSPLEVAEWVVGRPLEEDWESACLKDPEQIIFVPSAHIGPYLGRIAGNIDGRKTLWFFFGARQPRGVAYPSIDLSRSELLTRLNALGDDTRLRILSLLTEYEELCSQDILLKLNLSQSAVSRHLKQLSAAGFLIERSQAAAKCYRLSPRRIEDTLQALERFLLVK
jgi:ArsR family transcriptional regulator